MHFPSIYTSFGVAVCLAINIRGRAKVLEFFQRLPQHLF